MSKKLISSIYYHIHLKPPTAATIGRTKIKGKNRSRAITAGGKYGWVEPAARESGSTVT